MKIPIVMKWCNKTNQWHMEHLNGVFIQEFFNCSTMPLLFEGLDKRKKNRYIVDIRKQK